MDKLAFKQFFNQCFAYCITEKRLVHFTGSINDAEEFFSLAISKFWVKSQAGEIPHKSNLKALVLVIAKRLWIDHKRSKNNRTEYSTAINEVEDYILYEANMYTNKNPVIAQEEQAAAHLQQQNRLNLFQAAFAQLDQKCRDLLNGRYVYKIKGATLAKKFGFSNANVIKTSIGRCKKKLIKLFSENQTI